ncbi:hypothetical protein EDC01DRAFT_596681, partial [Geopyxis carbonaria]
LITPSPNAEPYPITSIGQAVTSLNPQYAICHHDSLECTTIYSTKTWSYCSATVPCYNQPASHGWCTVTDCADIVTFSKDNSYFLQTSPTLSILPVVTNYALPYSDYAAQRHTAVHVEHCIEAECKTHKESWERNIYTNYEQSALPVTMHNYYPTPTVVTYSGITHSVTKPTTITYVTRSMKTVTHEAVKMTTVTIRHKPSAVYSSYCSSSLSSSSYEVKSSYSSYVPSYNASSKYIKPYSTPSYIVPSPYNTPS